LAKKVLISSIITSYNHEDFIEECLDSVLIQQGDFDHEIIIADDFSTDKTKYIVDKYAEKYSHIKVLPTKFNYGLPKNLQRAFQSSNGDFIAICEGDDYWFKDKLQKQLCFLENNPDLLMCFNKIYLLNGCSKKYLPFTPQESINKDRIGFDQFIKQDIANFSGCFYRKNVLKIIPNSYFEEEPKTVADWLFNLFVAYKNNIGVLKEYLSVYRLHEKGQWTGLQNHEKLKKIIKSYDLFLKYFPEKHNEIKTYRNFYLPKQKIEKKTPSVLKKWNTKKMQKKFLNNKDNMQVNYKKLNIGCGNIIFKNDWTNVDIYDPSPNSLNYLKCDVTKSFPFKNVEIVYCEHFIEHLTKLDGINFINHCYNSLISGGVLRIATFDLDELIDNCHSMNPDWKESCEAEKLRLDYMSKCEFINAAFHEWGHQYVYNFEDLKEIFIKGGFTDIRECEINKSEIPDLCNRESRFNSRLVVEGWKK
jgi:glycosyltransferase involved in cell wall biosynthesis